MTQEPTTGVNKRSYTIKAGLGVAAVAFATVAVIFLMTKMKTTPEPKVAETPAPSQVDVLTLAPESMQISVQSQGSIIPLRSIKLISEVGGRVISVADDYADGGFFDKDTPIVSIDSRDYDAALLQAQADVAKARELYALEKGRARQAKREWRDLGNHEANELFLRKPQLEAAKSAVDAALANRDRARLNVERTQVSAPFGGRIQKKHVDIGQYVSPGTVIADVYSTEAVLVRLPLTDKQIAKVALPLTAPSESATLPNVIISSVHGGKSYQWQGKIVRTEATLDTKSRVTYAVAQIDNPYENNTETFRPPLAVGMYVAAEILGVEMEGLTKIPRKAIFKENQVTLVDQNDEIHFRTVNVLQSDSEHAIVSGLYDGERLMLTRVPFAVAGLKVDPKDEAIADNISDGSSPTSVTGKGG